MNSNQRANQIAIKQFRKELSAMLDDIIDIDIKILNRAVNEGVRVAKQNTNVVSGFMRKSWRSAPAVKAKRGGVTKSMVNTADYAAFVNYGHRLVNDAGETIGWVNGQFMLEKAISKVNKTLEEEFKKEIERVKREHDK